VIDPSVEGVQRVWRRGPLTADHSAIRKSKSGQQSGGNCNALSVALATVVPCPEAQTQERNGPQPTQFVGRLDMLIWDASHKIENKEKGLSSLQCLDSASCFGSTSWARTNDLRINSP
jgi:hypothetical protein